MSGKTDKAHKALKEFQRKKYNKACFVCAKTGIMANVDMKTKTFVCTQCGGLLRELSHPIKGVSMTRFGQEEVDALLAGGNRRAAKTWLAGLPETFKRPDADNGKAVKAFMVRLYSGSEWHASKHPKAAKKKSSKKKKAAAAAAATAAAPGQGVGRSESAIDLDAELEKGPAKAAKPVEAPVVDLLAGLEDLDFQPVAPPQPASRGADPFGGGGGGADEDSDGNPFGSSDEEDSDSDEDDDEDDAPPPVQDDNGFGSFGFDDEPAPQQPSHQQQGSMHDFFAEAPAPAPVQPVLLQQQPPQPPQQAAFPADRGAALRGLVDYIGKLRSSFNMSPAEVRAEVQRALDQTVGPAPVQQPPAPAASPFGVDPSPPPPAASPFGGPPPPQQQHHHHHHQHGAPSGGGGYPPQQHGGFPPQQHGGYPPQQHQQHGGGYPPQQHGGGYPPQQHQQQQQFGGPPGGPPGGPYGGPPPAEPAFVPESRQPPPKVEDPGADDMFSFANPLG